MKTYATLGGIKFEIPSVEGMSETVQWEYKEQETVAEKVVLQFGGAKAKTMELKIKLMAKFCNPEQRKKDLEDKAKKIAPLPLILANGTLLGYFVIAEIAQNAIKTDAKGNIIAADLTLKLMEGDGTGVTAAGGGKGGAAGSKGGAAASPLNPNIKKPITPVGSLPIPDPIVAIGNTMLQKQQLKIGRVPNIDEALRRIPG